MFKLVIEFLLNYQILLESDYSYTEDYHANAM